VTGTGKARAGFSLMEILMAVGILGVGMTMVASVFPVAVDQSLRGNCGLTTPGVSFTTTVPMAVEQRAPASTAPTWKG